MTTTRMFRSGLALVAGLTAACTSLPNMKPYAKALPPPVPVSGEKQPPSALDLPRIEAGGGKFAGEGRPPYRVGPLDRISVLVWKQPDLGSRVPVGSELRITTVAEDGTVTLPFLEPIAVAGRTVKEINALIQSRYAQVVDAAQVETYLQGCASQSVVIYGAAHQPGTYYLCNNLSTMGDLVKAAGGLTADADLDRATVMRGDTAYRLDLRGAGPGESRAYDVLLQAGDSLYLPALQEHVVYVFGEVTRPGVFTIPAKGMSVVEAIGQAGGYNTLTANINSIYLARVTQPEPLVYKMKLSDLLRKEIGLTAGDRIYVPPTGLTRWNRWWRQVIPISNPEKYVP